MFRLVLILAVGAFFLVACATPQHLTLQAPAKDAPIEERIEAYDNLRPLNVQQRTGVYAYNAGSAVFAGAYNYIDYLQLNDGQRVQWVEDILPVVDEDSPSAKAVARWNTLNEQRAGIGTASWITMAATAGVSLAAGTAGVIWLTQVQPKDSGPPIGLIVSGYTGFLYLPIFVNLGFLIATLPIAQEMDRERETAFELYDRSLRERLDLPREGPVAPPAAPAAAAAPAADYPAPSISNTEQ